MAQALVNGLVLIGRKFVEGSAVILDGPRIDAVVAEEEIPAGIGTVDLRKLRLVPGFKDRCWCPASSTRR